MPGQRVPAEGGDPLPAALQTVQELVDVHSRAAAPGLADRLSAVALGGGYLAAAVVCSALADVGPRQFGIALPLIVLYVFAYRTEFVSTSGSAVPTEPVLVGMLLLLPPALVPVVVLVALQFGGAGALRSGQRFEATFVQWATGWHCLGPVAVLWTAGAPPPSLTHAPLYLAALLAQFVVDATVALIRTKCLGVPLRRLVRPLAWTFATDALMAPIGLCIVVAAEGSPVAIVLLAAPVALVHLLSRDRTEHLETAVSLSTALTAVHEEARVDALTGLANRRAWEEATDAAQSRIASGSPVVVTVVAADIDGLKVVNDAQGHEAGDALIVGMAEVLRRAVPRAAVIARLGGDEFGVLVVAERHEDAAEPAEVLLEGIRANARIHHGTYGVTLSASLGVARCPPEPSIQDAVRKADLRAAEDKVARRANRH